MRFRWGPVRLEPMSGSVPKTHATVHVVVAHPDGERVAAQAGALPHFVTDGLTYFGAGVSAEAHTHLGLHAALLRRLHFRKVSDTPELRVREVAWQLDLLEESRGLDWVRPATLPPDQRAWAESALAPPPPNRPAWQRPGWWAGTLAWLDAELARLNRPRSGEPEVLKNLQISCLAQVPTADGPLYFKAVPPFFAREVPVTAWLADHAPGGAPPVLARDDAAGRMLMQGAGDPSETGAEASLRHFARVQRATERWLPALRALGLPDHGPAWVRAHLEGLLQERHCLIGQEGGLTRAEAEQLLALRPRLEAACDHLIAAALPTTIGHGDLHDGNVAFLAGRPTILDWSDASLTCPFLDVGAGYFAPDATPEALDRLRDAYLAAWTDLRPLPELRALYASAQWAGEAYRALGYTLGIQPHVEDVGEWSDGQLYQFRRLLTLAGQGEPPASWGDG